jgi:dipeptidyl aminopeptidase/acylaminoacyl peptidase
LGVDAEGSTVYLVDNTGRDKSALIAIDLDTGEEQILAQCDDADIAVDVLMDDAAGVPRMAYAQMGDPQYYFLDETTKAVYAQLETQLGARPGVIQRSIDGNLWLVVPLDGGPDRFQLYNRRSDEVTELFPRFGGMKGHDLGKRTAHVVETSGGVKLPCHVYLPRGSDADGDGIPDAPLPTILYVHGGPSTVVPWDGWNGHSVRAQQLLANRGYAAIRVEFRGAGGFGNGFREAGHREWAGKALDDVVALANWAVDSGIADPGRIGIWGFSHGGYATLAALTWHPDVFACGFAWSAPAALDAWMDNPDFADYIEILAERYGDPRTTEGAESLKAQSPLYHADRISKPLLLVHGGDDRPVPPSRHSDPLASKLAERGVPVTYAWYDGEGHGFSRSASWVSAWAIAERFFAQHLGGRYEDFNDDLNRGAELEVRQGVEYIDGLADAMK